MRELESSLYVFKGNYLQLKKLLSTYENRETALQLWANPGTQDTFHLEVMRLLHNFVTAAKSLVDHTRVVIRERYGGESGFPEYQLEVDKRFSKNPLAQFVEDLREYCLHYRHLPIASAFVWVKEPPRDEFSVVLDLQALSKYPKWSSHSKDYLKIQEKDIDVPDLMAEYYNQVIEFHKWIHSKRTIAVDADSLD